jgi:hypothetical protein
MAWFLGNSRALGQGYWTMGSVIPLVIWSAVWTGLALWHAAKRGEKWWFIFFLLVHTAGIVEILYLIFVAHAFAKSSGIKKKKK